MAKEVACEPASLQQQNKACRTLCSLELGVWDRAPAPTAKTSHLRGCQAANPKSPTSQSPSPDSCLADRGFLSPPPTGLRNTRIPMPVKHLLPQAASLNPSAITHPATPSPSSEEKPVPRRTTPGPYREALSRSPRSVTGPPGLTPTPLTVRRPAPPAPSSPALPASPGHFLSARPACGAGLAAGAGVARRSGLAAGAPLCARRLHTHPSGRAPGLLGF